MNKLLKLISVCLIILNFYDQAFAVTYSSDLLTGGTASGQNDSANAYLACDDNTGTMWSAAPPNNWWQYDFGSAKVITKFGAWTGNDGNSYMTNFYLAGSNDGTNFTSFYSGTSTLVQQWDWFTFTNTTAYRYFRVYRTSGESGDATHFRELQAMSTVETAATVTTQNASNVETTTATGNGNITALGDAGLNCTRRGFCYKVGTSGDPTTSDSVAYDDGSFGTGSFTKGISGLSSGTGYRIRAYAVNGYGTAYGSTVQATTLSSGQIVMIIEN